MKRSTKTWLVTSMVAPVAVGALTLAGGTGVAAQVTPAATSQGRLQIIDAHLSQ